MFVPSRFHRLKEENLFFSPLLRFTLGRMNSTRFLLNAGVYKAMASLLLQSRRSASEGTRPSRSLNLVF